jgi:DNA end-binding protein Ku
VPVRVHSAIDSEEHVGFRLLHKKDHAPITYKKFCSREDVEVPANEIVRGYEVGEDEYTEVGREELDKVQKELGEGQHTIEVLQFVEVASLDPLLFERPYYVLPDEGGGKAYALLRDALRETGRLGVARLYLRRAVLGALVPRGDVLALQVLRPFNELRAPSALDVPTGRASEGEKRMARKLIDEMAAEWEPREHADRYRATLEKLLSGRPRFALGEDAAEKGGEKRPGKVVDLMEALRRSLASGEARGGRRRAQAAKRAGGARASKSRRTSSAR